MVVAQERVFRHHRLCGERSLKQGQQTGKPSAAAAALLRDVLESMLQDSSPGSIHPLSQVDLPDQAVGVPASGGRGYHMRVAISRSSAPRTSA
ncbi:hypothetical protein CFFPNG_02053 [Methylorubrum aminovorans]